MHSTHYHTLGIDERASSDQVRRAYIGLIAKVHPDRARPRSQKFSPSAAEINQAYSVLKNQQSRARYDKFLVCQRYPAVGIQRIERISPIRTTARYSLRVTGRILAKLLRSGEPSAIVALPTRQHLTNKLRLFKPRLRADAVA